MPPVDFFIAGTTCFASRSNKDIAGYEFVAMRMGRALLGHMLSPCLPLSKYPAECAASTRNVAISRTSKTIYGEAGMLLYHQQLVFAEMVALQCFLTGITSPEGDTIHRGGEGLFPDQEVRGILADSPESTRCGTLWKEPTAISCHTTVDQYCHASNASPVFLNEPACCSNEPGEAQLNMPNLAAGLQPPRPQKGRLPEPLFLAVRRLGTAGC